MQSLTSRESDHTIALLREQNALLMNILGALTKPKLGLHSDNPGGMKIYCNRQHGSLWYTLQNGEPVPVQATALTGYLRRLSFETCTRRNREVSKLLITIQGDIPYVLECGSDTQFCKGILAAVASLSPNQLSNLLTISPQPGDDDKVLFARVFIGGQLILTKYSEDSDWRDIAKQALANVKGANQDVVDQPF